MRRHHTGRVACVVRVVTDAEAFVVVVIMFIMNNGDDDDDDAYSSVNTSHETTRFLELLALFRGTLSYRARDCRVVE